MSAESTTNNTFVAKLAYTIREAACLSSLSRATLYISIRKKTLRAVKAGGRTLILHDDLMAFLKALPLLHSACTGGQP